MNVSAPRDHERRRYGRVQLSDDPMPALVDDVPVQVIELSVVGFRIAHESRFPPATGKHTMTLVWKDRTMRFTCEIVRSILHQIARASGEKSTYHTGVKIVEAEGDSELALRDFIAARIIRALEEQKANARGIPPISTYTYQVGKSNRYRRCEYGGGKWRQLETNRTDQPVSGFTISAEVAPTDVDTLCRTYEAEDETGRRLTQILAELSIRKEEGGTPRRYEP